MASPASHSTFGPLSFGPPPASIPVSRARQRIALLISADISLRERLRETLAGLRWQVREASSGAQAWAAATPPLMAHDYVHMTLDGYRLSADRFVDFLIPLIEGRPAGAHVVSND